MAEQKNTAKEAPVKPEADKKAPLKKETNTITETIKAEPKEEKRMAQKH